MKSRQRIAASPSAAEEKRREHVRHLSLSFGFMPHEWQLDGVCSLLSGTHTVVVRPAGDGKTLTAVLAAAALPGKVSLVVGPLCALAEEQCQTFCRIFAAKHQLWDGSRRRQVAVAVVVAVAVAVAWQWRWR